MPYLIVQLGKSGQDGAETLRFESASSAKAALSAVLGGIDDVIDIVSDSGELLRVRRDMLLGAYISNDPPTSSFTDGEPLVDIGVLCQRLGEPAYSGPNGFVWAAESPGVRLAFAEDVIVVWHCQGEPDLQVCMAEQKRQGRWLYRPCNVHRSVNH